MNEQSSIEIITSGIKDLSSWQQITYGAAMVTRMTQNYLLFCDVSGQGEPKIFRSILALVWEFAAGQNHNIDFIRQQDKLETAIPDTKTFDGFGVWPALDATSALSALLSACETSDIEEVVSIALLSLSTIESYLEVSEEEQLHKPDHPLLVADRDFSLLVMEKLMGECVGVSRKDCVKALKSMAESLDVSNIGVSFTHK